ncbi:Six-hairpin glycosidase [Penicillium verhagenii]|uniref:Six-hairpin glycosidase n=1 Tax=Penicillium verhagenii TaxID=1562060 RepID=UPI0025457520|nr:Six-hairpin glycosidase [Penicillium verhagenii]KAJ5934795.1 Six-hairpin glycosidase [Penicillium verhagenii]
MAEYTYNAIEDYGLIGDMHTCALVSKGGSLDYMCWPVFDSPSVFCRLLDDKKGGFWSIEPHDSVIDAHSKQRYLPYSNLLETRWTNEDGVVTMLDYFPVTPKKSAQSGRLLSGYCPCNDPGANRFKSGLQHSGLVRKLECSRGSMELQIEFFPAFNYARDSHNARAKLENDMCKHRLQTIHFESLSERLQLEIFADCREPEKLGYPKAKLALEERPGLQGRGLVAWIRLSEGQTLHFVLHSPEKAVPSSATMAAYLGKMEEETSDYWTEWTRKCAFRGHYRETVERSLLILKLLTYKPTGAIVAAPTFSLPENVGGSRNWDYRYSWVRDTAFTLYVFLKMGYSREAEAYVNFIFERIFPHAAQDMEPGSKRPFLPLMFTIRGEYDIPEVELEHLDGYRGSKPVRIGNAAVFHTQLDIYGELLDSIYLYNKHGNPITYDQWSSIRRMVNYVVSVRDQKDMSIWESRGQVQNFIYSKVMMWVALDRGIRLAEKRSSLPCPDRFKWIQVRDELYDEVMTRGFNTERQHFCQSYESPDVLDASILIAPLVFFVAPNDPRFINTLKRILQSPEKEGLSSAKMVFRYDHEKANDGVGGGEGAFIMVTFWLVEAMARAAKYDVPIPNIWKLALSHFDNILSYSNHLGMFSEEVAISGEQMGNTPQAFSHLACISAAINLERLGQGALSSDEEDFVSTQSTASVDPEAMFVKRHLSSFGKLSIAGNGITSSDQYGTRTSTPGTAPSVYTGSCFKPTAKNPMQLLELPLDLLKDIIKEVTHTNDLTSLALTCSTLHALTVPHMYSRFDIVWPESLNSSSDDYAGVDALSYGLSTLVMGEDVFHHAPLARLDRSSEDCSHCGCDNPHHRGNHINGGIGRSLGRRGNHYAQFTRTFSIGNGPLSWVQEYSVNREVGKMLGTLVALAVARMINLEAFIWDMPTGVVREIWLALASLADGSHGQCRLERIWVRWHDNSENPLRLSATLSSRVPQKYKHVEHPSLSVLPPLKSIAVLDIDETAYVEELAVLIERSRHCLTELRIGVALKAHLSDWVMCVKDNDPPIDSHLNWPKVGGILSILSKQNSVPQKEDIISRSACDSLQSDESTDNDTQTGDHVSRQGSNSTPSISKSHKELKIVSSNTISSSPAPKASGHIYGAPTSTNSEKLNLEVLELERVPLSIPHLLPQLDWTRLTTLTVMRCAEHETLWRALRRKYAPPQPPQKRSQKGERRRSSLGKDDYSLNIKYLRTDTVTPYLMLFIKDAIAPNTLESVYLHEAPAFDSNVNIEAIYRHIVRKHRLSLRQILIDASERNGNVDSMGQRWHKWMFNQEMVSFVTSGRMPQLRELGMAMHYRDWHYFLQRLPKMPQLRALYLPRISHSVHRGELKELALQVLDIVSIRPDLKITYIGLQSKCYQIIEKNGPSNQSDSDEPPSSNFGSGNDGLGPFEDDTQDTSDDDRDPPANNNELLSNDFTESDSEMEESDTSRVHFKLQEILFYDDKISIFKARHGVI